MAVTWSLGTGAGAARPGGTTSGPSRRSRSSSRTTGSPSRVGASPGPPGTGDDRPLAPGATAQDALPHWAQPPAARLPGPSAVRLVGGGRWPGCCAGRHRSAVHRHPGAHPLGVVKHPEGRSTRADAPSPAAGRRTRRPGAGSAPSSHTTVPRIVRAGTTRTGHPRPPRSGGILRGTPSDGAALECPADPNQTSTAAMSRRP